ncbi:MAG: PD40 domain-containing protein [Planctomycetales bacterium]|nr:PD40 domain-containing protein [Planctomycetales bacterium]
MHCLISVPSISPRSIDLPAPRTRQAWNFLKTVTFVTVIVMTCHQVASAQLQFGQPTPVLGDVNGGSDNWETNVSSDQLTIYFYSNRAGLGQIYTSSRNSLDDPWGEAVEIIELHDDAGFSGSPDVSSDGLTMVYNSLRSGGLGARDIWMTTRDSTTDPWGEPTNLGEPINSGTFEGWPTLSHDQLSLYYTSSRNLENELVVSHRESLDAPWTEPVGLGIQGGNADISADGLTLFYVTDGPYGAYDIWMMTRDDVSSEFGNPVALPEPINSSSDDFSPNLSDDGSTFYFYSRGTVWQAAVVPEPSGGLLSIMAALCLAVCRRRSMAAV